VLDYWDDDHGPCCQACHAYMLGSLEQIRMYIPDHRFMYAADAYIRIGSLHRVCMPVLMIDVSRRTNY